MPTILHTADLHIGSPFAGFPTDVAALLREETFGILEKLCKTAQTHDAMLIAGDLFDHPTPSGASARRVAELLETAQVPVYIAAGNHDYIHAASPFRVIAFPKNVHIFAADVMERIEHDSFVVYGQSYTSDFMRPLFDGFTCNDAKPSVMCLHAEVEPVTPKYCAVSRADIAKSGLSYLALGHIHKRSAPLHAAALHTQAASAGISGTADGVALAERSTTVYAQCGSPLYRSFTESGPRGAYAVYLAHPIAAVFVDTETRPFITIEVDITDADDIDAATEREAAAAGAVAGAVLRVCYTGVCAPEHLRINTRGWAVKERLGLLHVDVTDDTRLPRNVAAADDSLAGLVLKRADEMVANGADASETELAIRYALAAIDGEEVPLW